MLPELVDFKAEIVLVMNSGVQFLDFGIEYLPKKEPPGEFAEHPGTTSLARLEYDQRRDRYVHPAKPDSAVRPLLSVPMEESLTLLQDIWLPIPILRVSVGERFDEGPSNWARGRITALVPDQDREHPTHTHRITIACDTRVYPSREDTRYLAPTLDDVQGGKQFCLAHRAHWMGWFLDSQKAQKSWVTEWVEEVFRDHAQSRLRMPQEDIDAAIKNRVHQAHYLNVLHVLGKVGRNGQPLRLRIRSHAPEDPDRHIPVDLLLDVGNSRTCGILIENHPQENDGLRNRYELALRDLSQPQYVYAEPFPSRVEFAQAMFGKEHFSHNSGRHDAFVWPTMVRIGKEAALLAARRRGTEKPTGLSSPKRYLWDTEPYEPGWRLNTAFMGTETGEPLATLAPFANLINELGEPLYEKEQRLRQPVFNPRYTRSSLMMFMLSEIIAQAVMQINSPAQRLRQSNAETPRFLRSITLTVPPSMPKPERDIFRDRVTEAMHLVWKAQAWHPKDACPKDADDDPDSRPFPAFPAIRVEWDEATCGQVVYLYSEIKNNFSGHTEEFFDLMRRSDGDGGGMGGDRKLTVASVDIGGGTTDLVITDFELDQGEGMNVFIVPKQRFRDGFKLAGDDIVLQVIQMFIVPALAKALESHGVKNPRPLLARLIGADAMDVQDETLRQQLTLQVFYPLGLRVLMEYEHYDYLSPMGLGMHTFGSLLSTSRPSPEVLDYVAGAVRREVGGGQADFDLLATPLEIELKDVHHRFMSGHMDIYRTIRALCEVIYLYQCDVLLLTGRPSLLPGIQALFRALLPLPPGRIVPMHNYHTGGWYPFSRDGRIDDPKTTAAVGAMLCILGRGYLPDFFFRADTLRPYSTVRFIGQMDDNGIISKKNEFYRDVDLDNEEYELPEEPFSMRGPMRLGFRQLPIERWPAAPLYTLSFAEDKLLDQVYKEGEVVRVSLKQERRKPGSERFCVLAAQTSTGNRPSAIKLQLNTLANVGITETSYWLDSGRIYKP